MSLSDFFESTDLFPFQGRGIVERTIQPLYPGRVHFQATSWPARMVNGKVLHRLQPSLKPGDPVEVVGREGLTLLIQPVPLCRE